MIRLLSTFAVASALIAIFASKTRAYDGGWRAPLETRGGVRWVDHAIGFALTCALLAVLLRTAPTLGFVRDEGIYFDATKAYAGWFEKLFSPDETVRASAKLQSVIDPAWAPNAEHPSLMKSGFALSWIYLFRTWPAGLVELLHRHWYTTPASWFVAALGRSVPKLFVEESAAFRFPGMLAGALTLWLTYIFGAEARGRGAGLLAALLFAGLPRTFFDAHLACFDSAATLMWLAVAYAYWKGLASAWWSFLAGVVWGIALLTKHNSWFLPAVFLLHYLWLAYDVARARPGAHPRLRARLRRLPIPWPFLFMGMLGPAIFVAGWPRLWFDTWARIRWYFEFHAHHDYYNVEYLHQTYFQPPMPVSLPYVLTLATVPATALVACLIGIVRARRAIFAPLLPGATALVEDARRTSFFWFLNLNLPIALIAHPKVPHFGGTKHWHPAYPFLCLFAGAACAWAIDAVGAWASRKPTAVALVRARVVAVSLTLLVVAPGFVETAKSHPHGLSHYTPLVGGSSGGASLGLNRGFWGYETGAIVEWLNTHLPKGGRVYPNDTYFAAWEQLRADGRLHANIEAEWWNLQGVDVAVVEHEQHMDEVEHQIWVAFGSVTPAYVVTIQGVPTLSVYVNPKSGRFVP